MNAERDGSPLASSALSVSGRIRLVPSVIGWASGCGGARWQAHGGNGRFPVCLALAGVPAAGPVAAAARSVVAGAGRSGSRIPLLAVQLVQVPQGRDRRGQRGRLIGRQLADQPDERLGARSPLSLEQLLP